MRALILIAGAALALAACRNNSQSDNTVNLDQGLTAENIASNDVTAIDAVTGADANMAADVNFVDFATDNASDSGNASSERPRPSGTSRAKAASSNTSAPSSEPTGNAASNVTANNSL